MHIFPGGSIRWITSVLLEMVKTQNIWRRELLQAHSGLVYTTYQFYIETVIIREPCRNFDDDVWVMSTGGAAIWSEGAITKLFNAHYVSAGQVGSIISNVIYIVQLVGPSSSLALCAFEDMLLNLPPKGIKSEYYYR